MDIDYKPTQIMNINKVTLFPSRKRSASFKHVYTPLTQNSLLQARPYLSPIHLGFHLEVCVEKCPFLRTNLKLIYEKAGTG